ncbi:MAG: hypothetical protein KTR14_10560 [Vampirovibrio sp.]|nr:hypothetical protein [Vampirovibrio sp.]
MNHAFEMIQSFFTRMRCNFCMQNFEEADVELMQENEGVFVVKVNCHHCEREAGVAVVGVEVQDGADDLYEFKDPEFTEEDFERLGALPPIREDDVLDAHEFFQGLDENWQSMIPKELMPEEITSEDPSLEEIGSPDTTPETESHSA